MSEKIKRVIIGIDPGVKTGVAVYDLLEREFISLDTLSILKAIELVKMYKPVSKVVLVEDARQVQYKTDRVKAQGAGSIKRDCKIWEEFLVSENMESAFLRPSKKITKLDESLFKRLSGWTKRTSNHARDAGMIVLSWKGVNKLKR